MPETPDIILHDPDNVKQKLVRGKSEAKPPPPKETKGSGAGGGGGKSGTSQNKKGAAAKNKKNSGYVKITVMLGLIMFPNDI